MDDLEQLIGRDERLAGGILTDHRFHMSRQKPMQIGTSESACPWGEGAQKVHAHAHVFLPYSREK